MEENGYLVWERLRDSKDILDYLPEEVSAFIKRSLS